MEQPVPKRTSTGRILAITAGLLIVFFALVNSFNKSVEKNDPKKVSSIHIDEMQVGDKWPFAYITKGDVKCIDGTYVVLETELGTFAMNGSAKQVRDEKGWKLIDEFVLPGKDVSPIIKGGLQLCK